MTNNFTVTPDGHQTSDSECCLQRDGQEEPGRYIPVGFPWRPRRIEALGPG